MIRIFNSLKRQKEEFIPLHPPFVGMYVCGPTVQDYPHLGHAKSYVSFDIVVRTLRAAGFKVRYVQNITDVGHMLGENEEGEDRILKRAKTEQMEPIEIAQKYERIYFQDMDSLNCLRPDISSRATGHILEMIELVKQLIEKGFAYETDGNVYYDVSKFPDYGKLSGRKVEDMKEGTRVKAADDKRNPVDFALWKQAGEEHIMRWPSPWSAGFPGWHLECSVMAMKYLGESIDIHGGGLDNKFPHHECEIAQSEAVTGKPFVKYWMHNNMVTLDGQKMSKSLGNSVTLGELFEKYDPMIIRFFILQGHYRSPQDFSDRALEAAKTGYERLSRTVLNLSALANGKDAAIEAEPETQFEAEWKGFEDKALGFLHDDFNTAGTIATLFDAAKAANSLIEAKAVEEAARAAAFFNKLAKEILGLQFGKVEQQGGESAEEALAGYILEIREQMRKNKQYAEADAIRDHLEKLGFSIEDGPDGSKAIKKIK